MNNHLKVGIRLEALGLPLRRALPEAQRLGVRGVQADAAGDLSPHALSQTGRAAFRHLLGSHNLELTALGCPLRRGLDRPEDQQQRIDHVEAVLGLSVDLGSRIAIVQAGRVPEKADDRRASLLTEALRVLGRHGDRVGAVLALETGLESGAVLGAFLDCFDTGGLGVNLDPANLLMGGFDPYESARALHGRVVHSSAKDARVTGASRIAQEVPLGQGDIDWARYLATLEEIDYRGWLTVAREGGDNRVADVAEEVGFLRRFLGSKE
ncbi:MAG TPA: sugar phosphate isomerase/epimerase family protein [Gemmataceae bacterium]|nr:sugar phosphate isomerase/epimerase family protein [Gemmataceae bacterium]